MPGEAPWTRNAVPLAKNRSRSSADRSWREASRSHAPTLRMVQHRLLPGEDRVRELSGVARSRSLSPVRASPQARSSPSAQRSVFRRVFVMLRPVQSHSEQTSSNQASGPKIRGHFMLSSIGAKVRRGLLFVGSSNDRRTSDFPILRGIAKPCCGVPLLVGQLGPSF